MNQPTHKSSGSFSVAVGRLSSRQVNSKWRHKVIHFFFSCISFFFPFDLLFTLLLRESKEKPTPTNTFHRKATIFCKFANSKYALLSSRTKYTKKKTFQQKSGNSHRNFTWKSLVLHSFFSHKRSHSFLHLSNWKFNCFKNKTKF